MHEIVGMQNGIAYIRTPEGGVFSIECSALRYQYPSIGDKVAVYWDGQLCAVFPLATRYEQTQIARQAQEAVLLPSQQPAVHQPALQPTQSPASQQTMAFQEAPQAYSPQSLTCQQQISQQYAPQPMTHQQQPQQPNLKQSLSYQQSAQSYRANALTYQQQPQQYYPDQPVVDLQSAQGYQPNSAALPSYETQTVEAQSILPESPKKNDGIKRINKHLFVWVFCGLLGNLGVDRFIRGQIPLGIVKLLTGGGLLIWGVIDWVISISKAYGSSFSDSEDLIFIDGQYAR